MDSLELSRNLSHNSQVIAATAEDQNRKSNRFAETKEDPRTRMINKLITIFCFLGHLDRSKRMFNVEYGAPAHQWSRPSVLLQGTGSFASHHGEGRVTP